jgi:hypothetical protein
MSPPPPAVLRVVNPLMRRLLVSPLANRMPPAMALLEYEGRRSGKQFAIPVGVHDVDGNGSVVFTEAPWRRNFEGGRELTLSRGRNRRPGRGILVEDPEAVADALVAAVAKVGPRGLAMTASPGHDITRDDLLRLGRTMLRVELDQ